MKPEELLGEIAEALSAEGHIIKIDDKKFKLKATLKAVADDDEEMEDAADPNEDESVELTVKIL